jgi:hypothetical protein
LVIYLTPAVFSVAIPVQTTAARHSVAKNVKKFWAPLRGLCDMATQLPRDPFISRRFGRM